MTTAKTQDFRSQYLPALKSDVITYSFANILSSFCCYPVSNCDGSQASRLSAENPTGLMVLVTFIQHELWDLDNTGWHTFIVRTGMSSGLFCMLVKPLRPFHGSKTCAAVTSPHFCTHIQSSKFKLSPRTELTGNNSPLTGLHTFAIYSEGGWESHRLRIPVCTFTVCLRSNHWFTKVTHLGRLPRASCSNHQHHPVFSDEFDDFLFVFLYRQGASKSIMFWGTPLWRHHRYAFV